jgi:hypothetical protein
LIDQFGKEEVLREFEEARRQAADQHAADGWTILDEAPEVREALDKAKAKSEYKKWLAMTGNRAKYGPATAQVNVTVNNAALHLDALRSRRVDARTAPVEIAPEPLHELLPSGDD